MENFFGKNLPQVTSELGVIVKTPAQEETPVKDFKARRYVFTLFDFNDEKIENLKNRLHHLKNLKFIIGEEICPSTGRPHLQGYLESKNQVLASTLNNIWRARWKKASKFSTLQDNLTYCSKDGKVRHSDWPIAKPVKLIDPNRDWQIKILKELEQEPDDRTINWYWSKEGGIGKTQFVKYVAKKFESRCRFSTTNKSSDIVTIADECIDIYLFNFTRTTEGFCPFMALESLKDGLVSEGKLKKNMRQVIMNSPHIYVFANYPPDKSKMSKDRWNVIELS